MAERARIAKRHQAGSVGCLLNCEPQRPLRNHARDNVNALRAMERQLRSLRAKEALAADRASFKLKQFENVPSRLHESPEDRVRRSRPSSAPLPERPRSANAPLVAFGRCVPQGPQAAGETRSTGEHRGQRAAGGTPRFSEFVPDSRAGARCAEDEGFQQEERCNRTIDFGEFERTSERLRRQNAGARRIPARDAEGRHTHLQHPTSPNVYHEGRAEVPVVPQGYRLMPEEERLATLDALTRKLEELDLRYAQLPLKIETEGPRQQQRSLREMIAETEGAVKLFSRPKVLVEV